MRSALEAITQTLAFCLIMLMAFAGMAMFAFTIVSPVIFIVLLVVTALT